MSVVSPPVVVSSAPPELEEPLVVESEEELSSTLPDELDVDVPLLGSESVVLDVDPPSVSVSVSSLVSMTHAASGRERTNEARKDRSSMGSH